MYTYESFETMGTFILLRPIFHFLLTVSFLLLVVVLLPKRFNQFLNAFSVLSISLISVFVSVQTLYFDAIIVDKIGLGGDPVSFFMTLATILFSILASIIYLSKSVIPSIKEAKVPQ